MSTMGSASEQFVDRFWEEVGRLATLTLPQDAEQHQHRIAEALCSGARTVAGADGACVVFREGEEAHYSSEDAVAPLWAGRRFPLKQCISGWSILHGVPVVVEDIYADSRIPVEYYRDTFVKSLAIQPIERTRPFGAIAVYWARRHRADSRQLGFLQALADLAALVLTSATLSHTLSAMSR